LKVVVAGGGPAGLSFSMLLKQRHPDSAITVVERDRPGDTYGWGITLPRRMLSRFEGVEPATVKAVLAGSVTWSEIQVFHRGRRVEIHGMPLLGIARVTLLEILRRRCEELGVDLRFGALIDPASLPDYDLLVIADGAGSGTRGAFEPEFGTTRRAGRNRYTWLGTPLAVAGLTLALAEHADGLFIAHAYPFSRDASTFIVECGEETWQRARFDRRSSEDCCAYLAAVFSECLRGQPLLFRRSVRWAAFTHVQNEHWRRERMVLLGDAAHAIHFSVGSGTMLAMDDAMGLVEQLEPGRDVTEALEAFERARQPVIAGFVELERTTVARLERMQDFADLEPLELAYLLLSR
jgi:anthraniloyl-CoA monooxygenase